MILMDFNCKAFLRFKEKIVGITSKERNEKLYIIYWPNIHSTIFYLLMELVKLLVKKIKDSIGYRDTSYL